MTSEANVMNLEMGADGAICNCTTLRKVMRRVSLLYDEALAPSGLSVTQRSILAQIRRSGSLNVGSLASAMVMDSGALAHTLQPLERDGYTATLRDPTDRRHRIVSLTPSGHKKLLESDVLWQKAQNGFHAAFGLAESVILRESLGKLLTDDFVETFRSSLDGAQQPTKRRVEALRQTRIKGEA